MASEWLAVKGMRGETKEPLVKPRMENEWMRGQEDWGDEGLEIKAI